MTNVFDATHSLDAFLAAAGARQPTPGGGSVTALVGALSAAMGEMVLNYSAGRKDLEAHEPSLRSALEEFVRARKLLMQLMIEDQAAYDALTRIRKEGAEQDSKLPPALLACLRIPQSVGATAVAILDLCDKIADKINPHLVSDLAVCAELAMATARCAAHNVRVNIASLTQESERVYFERENARLLSNATALIKQVFPRIWARQQR